MLAWRQSNLAHFAAAQRQLKNPGGNAELKFDGAPEQHAQRAMVCQTEVLTSRFASTAVRHSQAPAEPEALAPLSAAS